MEEGKKGRREGNRGKGKGNERERKMELYSFIQSFIYFTFFTVDDFNRIIGFLYCTCAVRN